MRIIDCFMFGLEYELDILELRLEYLYPIIDCFVITEAKFDHQHGRPKDLYFNKNKDRFRSYFSKIHHVIVESPITTIHNDCIKGVNENYHRNQVVNDIEISNDDIIILSDLDEFPNIESIEYYKNNKLDQPFVLCQDMYYYYMNMKAPYNWNGTIMVRGNYYINGGKPQGLRDKRCSLNILPVHGGWHFSYMGGSNAVKQKIDSIYDGKEFEKNKDDFSIEEHIEKCFLHLPNRATLNKVDMGQVMYPINIKNRYEELKHKGLMK